MANDFSQRTLMFLATLAYKRAKTPSFLKQVKVSSDPFTYSLKKVLYAKTLEIFYLSSVLV